MDAKRITLGGTYRHDPVSLYGRVGSKGVTFSEFEELHEKFLFEKGLEGLAKRSIENYISHLTYLKNFYDEEQQTSGICSSLNDMFFKNYIYYMTNIKQLKPSTVNIRLRTLKCYLKWLYTNGYTADNIALKIKLQKVAIDTIQPLTKTDVKKMLSAPNSTTYAGLRDYTIMMLILDTGARINEICSIEIESVNLKSNEIYIKGENSKTRSFRILPISKALLELLENLIEIAKIHNSAYVFNSTVTKTRVESLVIIKNFEKYGKKMDIKVRCTPHVFRHTFATNAVKAGMDIFTLQKLLGHNDIYTTRKYIQLSKKDVFESHQKYDLIAKYM